MGFPTADELTRHCYGSKSITSRSISYGEKLIQIRPLPLLQFVCFHFCNWIFHPIYMLSFMGISRQLTSINTFWPTLVHIIAYYMWVGWGRFAQYSSNPVTYCGRRYVYYVYAYITPSPKQQKCRFPGSPPTIHQPILTGFVSGWL